VESGNSLSGEIYKEESVYQIFSPQLKKECRRIILCGYVEDGGFSRFGMNIGFKWYEYEKGNGTQPDKFSIKEIRPEEHEEIQRRKEQMKHDREKLEKNRKEFEEKHKEWEKSFGNSKKQCNNCGKELDSKAAKEISIGEVGNNLERVYFCSGSDCSASFFKERDNQRKKSTQYNLPWGKNCSGCGQKIDCGCYVEWNGQGSYYCSSECANKHEINPNNKFPHERKKCVECGEDGEGKDYWGWVGSGDGLICDSCLDKRPKKSETELEQIRLKALKSKQIEQERNKINDLKSKLQYSTNPAEKEELQTKIKEAEGNINKLKGDNIKDKNNSTQPNSPKKDYGKIILIGTVILVAGILISYLVIRKRKKHKLK